MTVVDFTEFIFFCSMIIIQFSAFWRVSVTTHFSGTIATTNDIYEAAKNRWFETKRDTYFFIKQVTNFG